MEFVLKLKNFINLIKEKTNNKINKNIILNDLKYFFSNNDILLNILNYYNINFEFDNPNYNIINNKYKRNVIINFDERYKDFDILKSILYLNNKNNSLDFLIFQLEKNKKYVFIYPDIINHYNYFYHYDLFDEIFYNDEFYIFYNFIKLINDILNINILNNIKQNLNNECINDKIINLNNIHNKFLKTNPLFLNYICINGELYFSSPNIILLNKYSLEKIKNILNKKDFNSCIDINKIILLFNNSICIYFNQYYIDKLYFYLNV